MGRSKNADTAKARAERSKARLIDHNSLLAGLRKVLCEAKQEKESTGAISKAKYLSRVKALPRTASDTKETGSSTKSCDLIVRPGDFLFFHEVDAFLNDAEAGGPDTFPDIEKFISALRTQMKNEALVVDTTISVTAGRHGHSAMYSELLIRKLITDFERALTKPTTEWKTKASKKGEMPDVERMLADARKDFEKLRIANTASIDKILDPRNMKEVQDITEFIDGYGQCEDVRRRQMWFAYLDLKSTLYRFPTTHELRSELQKHDSDYWRPMAQSQFSRNYRGLDFVFTPLPSMKALGKHYEALKCKMKRKPTASEFRKIVRKITGFKAVAELVDDEFVKFSGASGFKLTTGK